ncbi:MAG: PDZ domain-containing protein [Pirellula sp.]
MKNWISWIVGGALAVSTVSYDAFRVPLHHFLFSSQSMEQVLFASTADSDVEDESDDPYEDVQSNTRLVQQPGSSRFARTSQQESSRANHRNHYSTLRAFKDSVGDNWKSTVQILERSRQIAMGAIVATDGWVVTKASEVPGDTVEVRLHDQSIAQGVVKSRRNDLDLALIKIERNNLPVIQWAANVEVPVGAWLVTSDMRSLPIAIGVLSVSNRNVASARAVLGVELTEPPDNAKGALVANVVEGSGAARAGVRSGDVIYGINGDLLTTKTEVWKRLQGLAAGQRVDVVVRRDGAPETKLTAQMMDLNQSLLDPTEMEVNGEISARATGFNKVFQHDTVIAPHQCGGPVVDVYGNVVGINIARAGRVASYAIPAKIAAPAIVSMLSEATGKTANGVMQASSQIPLSLPASIPSGIAIESLKPEVVLPNVISRP